MQTFENEHKQSYQTNGNGIVNETMYFDDKPLDQYPDGLYSGLLHQQSRGLLCRINGS